MKKYYVIKCNLMVDYFDHPIDGYVGIDCNTDSICASNSFGNAMRFESVRQAVEFWKNRKDKIIMYTYFEVGNPRVCRIEEEQVWDLGL